MFGFVCIIPILAKTRTLYVGSMSSSLFFFKPLSWLLGLVDLSFLGLSLLGSRRPKFFSSGWGDLTIPYDCQDKLLKQLESSSNNKIPDAFLLKDNKIEWTKETRDGSILIKEARFKSPLAHLLPPESEYCRFHLVSPIDTNEHVYIVMLPATGEMGKRTRLRMAKSLANQYGWSTIVVNAPFYGVRKPKKQRGFFMDSVSDILLQSQAMIQESGMLISYFLNLQSSKVCVTGFSWGGAMSAISSSIALLANTSTDAGSRLACVPYVGSASPAVIVDGIISSSVDWDALKDSKEPLQEVQSRLLHEFEKTNLSDITAVLQRTKRNTMGVVKVVATHDDQFIRRPRAQEFIAQAKGMGDSSTKFSTWWLPGGHIFAMLFRPYFQKMAIVDAVKELKKKQS